MRTLCRQCKRAYKPDPTDLPDDFPGRQAAQLWSPVGCRACRDTGFSGRSGVFELLVNDAEVRRLCIERASAGAIRDHALRHGMLTLRQYGYKKALAGETTVDEVARITRGDIS